MFNIPLLAIFLGALILFATRGTPPRPTDALHKTHRLLNIPPTQSKLGDPERKTKQHQGQPTVQSLWVYPVKSCRGVELERCLVTETGLKWDRIYTLAKRNHSGGFTFVSQRLPKFQALAKVGVEIWVPRRGYKHMEECIVVHFPRKVVGISSAIEWLAAKFRGLMRRGSIDTFRTEALLPVTPPSNEGYAMERLAVQLDTITALNISPRLLPALQELQGFLGITDDLFMFMTMPPSAMPRKVERSVPSQNYLGYQPVINFQDGVSLPMIVPILRFPLTQIQVPDLVDESRQC
jgi:hypothetical protein